MFQKVNVSIRMILLGMCVFAKQVLIKIINKINNNNYSLAVLGGVHLSHSHPLIQSGGTERVEGT